MTLETPLFGVILIEIKGWLTLMSIWPETAYFYIYFIFVKLLIFIIKKIKLKKITGALVANVVYPVCDKSLISIVAVWILWPIIVIVLTWLFFKIRN